MLSSVGMHLWSRSEASVEEEGSRIRESSQRAAASSAFPRVSPLSVVIPASPSAAAESGSEHSGRGEVLRGPSRTWSSEQRTSSYMSHCSSTFSYLLFPSCACVCLIFFFFLSFSCNYALLPSTLGCVWNPTHTSLLMPLVAPRCWSSERAKYRERQRERGGVWWAKRDDGSREYCFSPPVPSINIILIMKSLAEVELMSHFYICASLRARHARAHMFLWVLRMLMKALNCFLQMNTNTHHTHTHVRAQQSNKQQQKISSGDQ